MHNISRFYLFSFVSCLLLLSSCSSNKNVVVIPSWVNERPINQAYYIGIATVSKHEYPYNAMDVARENALNSLAREIRVQVNSESVLSTLQVNHWVEESFASNITSTVAEDLEGYTLMGSYEDESEVHVYYRLSKAEYARILAERKRVALGIAYGHYLDAERLLKEGSIPLAIERYLIGLDAMSKYLAEENPYVGEDGVEFKLDRALLKGLTEGITKFEIECMYETIEVTLSDNYTKSIKVSVSHEGMYVGGVPLSYNYSRGRVPIRGQATTSGDGLATIVLNDFYPGTKHSILEVELDVQGLVSILQPLSPLKPLVENLNSAPLLVPIELEPPKIRVVGSEKLFGKKVKNKTLIPAIKAELIEHGVDIVDNTVDDALVLRVQADTRIGGEGRGFYTAFLNATLSLKDSEGSLVMQKTLDNVKGVQTERKRAGEEAYRKASKKVLGRFIETFVDALYQ